MDVNGHFFLGVDFVISRVLGRGVEQQILLLEGALLLVQDSAQLQLSLLRVAHTRVVLLVDVAVAQILALLSVFTLEARDGREHR